MCLYRVCCVCVGDDEGGCGSEARRGHEGEGGFEGCEGVDGVERRAVWAAHEAEGDDGVEGGGSSGDIKKGKRRPKRRRGNRKGGGHRRRHPVTGADLRLAADEASVQLS